MKKKTRKPPAMQVSIVGGAARDGQGLLERAGEIWCLNAIRPNWLPVSRITQCVNLHRYKHLKRDWHEGVYREAEWANRFPEVPFIVCDRWPAALLPNQVLLPRAELEAMPNGKYHARSIDWMVAWATLQGAKQINIHGISFQIMEAGEPISARACLEYWLGYARGRGVAIDIAPDCDALFKQFHYVRSDSSYGFDDVHMIEYRG